MTKANNSTNNNANGATKTTGTMTKEMNILHDAPPVINLEGEYNKFDIVKDKTLCKVKNLLDEYYHDNTEHGLNVIWNTYTRNKSGLASLLSRHPNWDEENLAIVFSEDYTRVRDQAAVDRFVTWLHHQISKWYDENCKDELAIEKYNAAKEFCIMIKGYGNNVADNYFAETANRLASHFNCINTKGNLKTLGAVPGMKVSRIVNKFFKNYGFDKIVNKLKNVEYDANGTPHERVKDYGWNMQFSAYADSINPYCIKRHTIISINLVDYLTMSHGNSWSSCHDIDKTGKRRVDINHNYSGMYCSGTLSYALDESSLIMYTVDDSYNGNDFCLQDKINRCVFCVGEDKILQSRVYPDGRESNGVTSMAMQFRAIMQKIIAECVGENNLWDLVSGRKACYDVTISEGTHYRDYVEYDDGCVMFLKRAGVKRNMNKITIGHYPICPCCGEEHEIHGDLCCSDCGDSTVCNYCGREIEATDYDVVRDEDTGNWYCDESCANEDGVFYCVNDDLYHSECVYEDNYTGEHFYDDGCCYYGVHFNGYDYLDIENAEADGWHYVESADEWYNEDFDDIFECPVCGRWEFKDDGVETEQYGFVCAECGKEAEEDK